MPIKARAGERRKFSTLVNEMMIKQEVIERRKNRETPDFLISLFIVLTSGPGIHGLQSKLQF